eukprot:scaffold798_cov162-Amphora_coffeaeformis.AAC.13
MDTPLDRRKRKEEGRRRKREKIAESGGKRPRQSPADHKPQQPQSKASQPKHTQKSPSRKHQFGRVMESVPCRNKPRITTLSIALPGSVVSNCQTKELRTQLVGQIARAATIYHVDEIVVFDDKLSKEAKSHHFGSFRRRDRDDSVAAAEQSQQERRPPFDPHGFMAKVLQYCECPQYLRRHFFPMHPDLQFAGLLAPIDAPHHVRADDHSRYREGVVLDKLGPNKGSLVNCGIRSRPVEIDATLQAGIRCTVQLETSAYDSKGKIHGKVVSPSAPREDNGTYWGYTVRMADSLKGALDECPYEGGYDLKIGTSERGTSNLDDRSFGFPSHRHALIVFGGVAGIEECVDADESFKLPGSESRNLFDMWVNICKFQGSRTIRTEEAVLITLAKMSPLLAATKAKVEESKDAEDGESQDEGSDSAPKPVEFSDAPSEESSESENDD